MYLFMIKNGEFTKQYAFFLLWLWYQMFVPETKLASISCGSLTFQFCDFKN
jgi:hypothetical protein